MTTQDRFAKDWGMDIDRVHKMVRIAKDCGRLNEKAVNGDPHPRNSNSEDKNRNMELWQHDCDVSTAELERFVNSYDFQEVAYTGLYPCLKKDGNFIEIPY